MKKPYEDLTDKELMLKYQKGDHSAFNCLYYRHSSKTYTYLSKRLHSKSEITDLQQKVYLKLHQSRNLYQEKYEVLPWLYTITRSVFLDHLKRKKPQLTEYEEQLHSQTEGARESLVDLDDERSLSLKEKSALEKRYYHDEEFKEIAQALETSESNVRKIISRAIKKLKNKYKGDENE